MQGSPTSFVPQKVQVDVIIMKKLIEELERGKKSAHMMRNIILQYNPKMVVDNLHKNNEDQQDYYRTLDNHSMVALNTYVSSLSMLKSCDFNGVSAGKRKLHHVDHDLHHSHDHGRRECHKKRRKIEESREEEVTHLMDDGFAWRKYGQKGIHNSPHPRHYYRCTHKQDQKCQATKQLQQISENPTKYKIIYHGNHTCNSNLQSTLFTIKSQEEEQSSSIFLSFDGSNRVNPLLFPAPAFPGVATMNHDSTSSSSDHLSISEDQTDTIIGVSSNHVCEQSEKVSIDENYFSTVTSDNLEEDYGFIMGDFSELLPDWWTC